MRDDIGMAGHVLRGTTYLTFALLAACGGGGSDQAGAAPPAPVPTVSSYRISGSVTGLDGRLVLQNNGGDPVEVRSDGTFTFASAVEEGRSYEVTVGKQPNWQYCTLEGAAGTASQQLGEVRVTCKPAAATVTWFAGSGLQGGADGNALTATFDYPKGIKIGPDGSFFVTESLGNRLRKISPSGDLVTTLVRNDIPQPLDGPTGVAVDGAGNAYLAEAGGGRIRKVTPDGGVSVVAITQPPDWGNVPNHGLSPGVSWLAVGADGALYGTNNVHGVVKITLDGSITKLAGDPRGIFGYADGTGAEAQFVFPTGIVADQAGNLYVGEGKRIRKVTLAGVVTTVAGTNEAGAADGPLATATFHSPQHLALDGDGNIYVADKVNNLVRRISPSGIVSTLAGRAGGATDWTGATATFGDLGGIEVGSDGAVYVVEPMWNTIRKIVPVRPQ